MLSYVWKTEHRPAATDCFATALSSRENYLRKLFGSVSADWNTYVRKQLGNMENEILISGEADFC